MDAMPPETAPMTAVFMDSIRCLKENLSSLSLLLADRARVMTFCSVLLDDCLRKGSNGDDAA